MTGFTGVPDLKLTADEYYIAMGVKKHPITHTVKVMYEDGPAFLPCISHDEAVGVRRSFVNYGKCKSVEILPGEVSA